MAWILKVGLLKAHKWKRSRARDSLQSFWTSPAMDGGMIFEASSIALVSTILSQRWAMEAALEGLGCATGWRYGPGALWRLSESRW